MCGDQCPDGMFTDISTSQCRDCDPNCQTCYSLTQCKSCDVGMYLHDGVCLETCPVTMLGLDDGTCGPCELPCQSCAVTTDKCTSCYSLGEYRFLYGQTCRESCPQGYFAELPDSMTCERRAEDTVPFVFLAVATIAILLVGIYKVCGGQVHLKNAIIAVLSPICVAEMLFLLYLTVKDAHW